MSDTTTNPLPALDTLTTERNALACLAFQDNYHNTPLSLLLSGFWDGSGRAVLPGGLAYSRLGRKHSQVVRYLSATREESGTHRPSSTLWSAGQSSTRQTTYILTDTGRESFEMLLPRVGREQGNARVLDDAPVLGRVRTLDDARERFAQVHDDAGALGVKDYNHTRGALFAASLTHRNPKHAWVTGGLLSNLNEDLSVNVKPHVLCRALGYRNERSLPVFLRAVASQGILTFEDGDEGIAAHLSIEGRGMFSAWLRACDSLARKEAMLSGVGIAA